MIDERDYLKLTGIADPIEQGGQELILFEIIGAVAGWNTIFVPFYSSGTLVSYLIQAKKKVIYDRHCNMHNLTRFPKADVLYFGTPTIVNDQPLFPNVRDNEIWTKRHEREVVISMCKKAKDQGYKKIICGLGSGDISVFERQGDLFRGSGIQSRVICQKAFSTFSDWVIELDLMKEEGF